MKSKRVSLPISLALGAFVTALILLCMGAVNPAPWWRNMFTTNQPPAAVLAPFTLGQGGPGNIVWITNAVFGGNPPTSHSIYSVGNESEIWGEFAQGSVNQSTVLGTLGNATGDDSSAFGYAARADATRSSAFGHNSVASATDSLAVGEGSAAAGDESVAVGNGAKTIATGDYGTAVGQDTSVAAEYGTAIGYSASAAYSGSTALGENCDTTEADQIMLGDDGVKIVGDWASAYYGNGIGLTNYNGATNDYQFVNLEQLAQPSASQTYYFYGRSNVAGFNLPGSTTNWAYRTPSILSTYTNTFASVTNGQIIASYVCEKTFTVVPAGYGSVSMWMAKGAAGACAIRAEMHIYNSESEILEHQFVPVSDYKDLTVTPTKYTSIVYFDDYSSTTNLYFIVKLVMEVTSGTPTVYLGSEGEYFSYAVLPTALSSFVSIDGDTMTAGLTNNVGYYGSGVGLTNVVDPVYGELWTRDKGVYTYHQAFANSSWETWTNFQRSEFKGFTGSAAAGTLTTPSAGYYEIEAEYTTLPNLGIDLWTEIYTNGVTTERGVAWGNISAKYSGMACSVIVYLPASCVITMRSITGSVNDDYYHAYVNLKAKKLSY